MHEFKVGQKFNKWTIVKKTNEKSYKNVFLSCKYCCGNCNNIKGNFLTYEKNDSSNKCCIKV